VWVVIAEQEDEIAGRSGAGIPLERAFALVCFRAGLDYQFEHGETGWKLVFTDPARPDCSPEPLVSDYVKRADAHRDLMEQAVSRGLRGHAAVPFALYQRHEAQFNEWAAE
jgi:hypothetical protein